MSKDYSWITQEAFDEKLNEIIDEHGSADELLSIPGVYELLKEYYNNAVIECLEAERDEISEASDDE